jgi:hypothetical protein
MTDDIGMCEQFFTPNDLLATFIRVTIEERETLFIATSPNIIGLIVTAHNLEALFGRLPEAIQQMLAAMGHRTVVFRGAPRTDYHIYVAVPVALAKRELDAEALLKPFEERVL